MKKLAIINGPNLNLLGKREPDVYGKQSLLDLEKLVVKEARSLKVETIFFQSNHEGELIDKFSALADLDCHGVVFNPGGFTHTSIALRDAIKGSGLAVIEVHISNVYSREEFRKQSFTAPVSVGVISGLGFYGYVAALNYLAEID